MRPYHRPMTAGWWLKRRSYVLFMLRELTSVWIAAFLVVYLVQLAALGRGAESYEAFLQRLRMPWWVAFHVLALVAALHHAITWFNLTPKAIVIRIGEERVSPILIAGANYALWLAVSVGVAWVVVGR